MPGDVLAAEFYDHRPQQPMWSISRRSTRGPRPMEAGPLQAMGSDDAISRSSLSTVPGLKAVLQAWPRRTISRAGVTHYLAVIAQQGERAKSLQLRIADTITAYAGSILSSTSMPSNSLDAVHRVQPAHRALVSAGVIDAVGVALPTLGRGSRAPPPAPGRPRAAIRGPCWPGCRHPFCWFDAGSHRLPVAQLAVACRSTCTPTATAPRGPRQHREHRRRLLGHPYARHCHIRAIHRRCYRDRGMP